MPYIHENDRQNLDDCIENMVNAIKSKLLYQDDDRKLWKIAGSINYCFSRVLGQLLEDVSYPKIAIITGVLENIKQEFYRRIAIPYEDKKILENGDIKEYKN